MNQFPSRITRVSLAIRRLSTTSVVSAVTRSSALWQSASSTAAAASVQEPPLLDYECMLSVVYTVMFYIVVQLLYRSGWIECRIYRSCAQNRTPWSKK